MKISGYENYSRKNPQDFEHDRRIYFAHSPLVSLIRYKNNLPVKEIFKLIKYFILESDLYKAIIKISNLRWRRDCETFALFTIINVRANLNPTERSNKTSAGQFSLLISSNLPDHKVTIFS